MIFNEIYSVYYAAAAKLINAAIDGRLNTESMNSIIGETAFAESGIYISGAIRNEEWKLIDKSFNTPIRNHAELPLTDLQLRFLKAISLDPRFRLFYDDLPSGLEDIEPLYSAEDFRCFDTFADGDPYTDEKYKANFKMLLYALKNKRRVIITCKGSNSSARRSCASPLSLEYSEKDDKFRLHCLCGRKLRTINVARILDCVLTSEKAEVENNHERKKASVTLEIVNERNVPERCMLGFSNYRRRTRRINDNLYEMRLDYYTDDETELLIRILSFGQFVRVTEPEAFVEKLRERLKKSRELFSYGDTPKSQDSN